LQLFPLKTFKWQKMVFQQLNSRGHSFSYGISSGWAQS